MGHNVQSVLESKKRNGSCLDCIQTQKSSVVIKISGGQEIIKESLKNEFDESR
jgi:hypothetical protein